MTQTFLKQGAITKEKVHNYTYKSTVERRLCYARYILQQVYLPELLERVFAGKILEVASNLSIFVNFKVFSFVMEYNNKKVGGIFGYHITFCVQTQYL